MPSTLAFSACIRPARGTTGLASKAQTVSCFRICPASDLQHGATRPAGDNKDIVKMNNPIVAISSKYHMRWPTRPFWFSRAVESFASQKSPDLAALITRARYCRELAMTDQTKTENRIILGHRVPWFSAPLITGGTFDLHVSAGRWVVLSFLGSPTNPRASGTRRTDQPGRYPPRRSSRHGMRFHRAAR
jgi:hypothetical protein